MRVFRQAAPLLVLAVLAGCGGNNPGPSGKPGGSPASVKPELPRYTVEVHGMS